MLRDKIKAALIGGAIGDAWGMPVETWNPERINGIHPGGVHSYVPPIGHKWFKVEEHPPGSTTDDTQLHVATMVGLIAAKKRGATTWEEYMDGVAQAHLDSMRITTAGAGDSTRLSVLSLGEGKTWRNSGVSGVNQKGEQMGTGNGVPMKIGALAAFLATPVGAKILDDNYFGEILDEKYFFRSNHFDQACIDFSSMTHATRMSAEASIAHARLVMCCLDSEANAFSSGKFLDIMCSSVQRYEDVFEGSPPVRSAAHSLNQLQDSTRRMATVFQQLREFSYGDIWNTHYSGENKFIEVARQKFGGGSCYLYNSMPFTYAFFLRYWPSIIALDYVVNAGGDTDTNGKMVGEMLGALHGMQIFKQPEWQWTLDGLLERQSLEDLADEFCDVMGVE